MIDESLYSKHQNAITTSQHTEISVEYAIQLLQEIAIDINRDAEKGQTLHDTSYAIVKNKMRALKALLK